MTHAVLTSLRRDRPPAAFQIDLVPGHAVDLVGSLSGQQSQFPRGRHLWRESFAGLPKRPDLVVAEHAISSLLDARAGGSRHRIGIDDIELDRDVEKP